MKLKANEGNHSTIIMVVAIITFIWTCKHTEASLIYSVDEQWRSTMQNN